MTDDLAGIIDAIGPRLRALRALNDLSLAEAADEVGTSVSLLSRLETGRRQPSLDVLIPLAALYRVSLDELIGAPQTGDPRTRLEPQGHIGGGVVVPLTGYTGQIQAFKHVIAPRPVRRATHTGRAWLFVLAGTLRLVLADEEFVLVPGETAEFDARTPHWFGPADEAPVEVLHLFGPRGHAPVSRVRQSDRKSGRSGNTEI